MDIPKIVVNGQEIELPRPNMKMWRRVAEYDEQEKTGWSFIRLMEEHGKMVAEMFGIESSDDIDPADVLPSYLSAASYIINVANEKLKQLPNAEAEKGES